MTMITKCKRKAQVKVISLQFFSTGLDFFMSHGCYVASFFYINKVRYKFSIGKPIVLT